MRPLGALVGTVVLAAVVALASGCGGGGGAGTLRARLLSAADLPSGWSAASAASAPKLANASCLAGLPARPTGWTYASAAFVAGVSIPNLGEVLAAGTRAAGAFARTNRALARCHAATLVLGATHARATIRRLPFPRLAHVTSAYRWTLTVAGLRIGFDLVLFRSGGYSGYVTYADLGVPPLPTVEAFTRAAVTKAGRGATAPIPDAISIASTPVRTVHTKLGTIGYRTLGHGSPLLLVTGYSGTMESWDRRFVDALAPRHRVITFDNAGIGETSRLAGRLTIDAMADQTSALICALHLGRIDVLGWSMGSMIAQALAVRHPAAVRRLVLCASYPGTGSVVRPSRRELNAFESGQPQQVLAALFPAGRTAARNGYLAAVSSYPSTPSVPASVLAAQRNAVDGWWNGSDPAGAKAAAIAVPTLIADGTLDRLDPTVNSRTLARLIPGATLQLYPGAGHAFLFQDRSRVVPLLEAFLR